MSTDTGSNSGDPDDVQAIPDEVNHGVADEVVVSGENFDGDGGAEGFNGDGGAEGFNGDARGEGFNDDGLLQGFNGVDEGEENDVVMMEMDANIEVNPNPVQEDIGNPVLNPNPGIGINDSQISQNPNAHNPQFENPQDQESPHIPPLDQDQNHALIENAQVPLLGQGHNPQFQNLQDEENPQIPPLLNHDHENPQLPHLDENQNPGFNPFYHYVLDIGPNPDLGQIGINPQFPLIPVYLVQVAPQIYYVLPYHPPLVDQHQDDQQFHHHPPQHVHHQQPLFDFDPPPILDGNYLNFFDQNPPPPIINDDHPLHPFDIALDDLNVDIFNNPLPLPLMVDNGPDFDIDEFLNLDNLDFLDFFDNPHLPDAIPPPHLDDAVSPPHVDDGPINGQGFPPIIDGALPPIIDGDLPHINDGPLANLPDYLPLVLHQINDALPPPPPPDQDWQALHDIFQDLVNAMDNNPPADDILAPVPLLNAAEPEPEEDDGDTNQA